MVIIIIFIFGYKVCGSKKWFSENYEVLSGVWKGIFIVGISISVNVFRVILV